MSYDREMQQVSDYVEGFFNWLRGQRGAFYIIVIAGIVLLWLASGIYVVQAGEEGVVRTFGRFSGVTMVFDYFSVR